MTHTSVGAGERHTLGPAQSMRPVALTPLFSSPSLPEAQAFQGGLVVREYPEDPEGEKKPSDPEESSAPSLGVPALGCASLEARADKRRDGGDKRHTPAGPAARSCPSKVPEHPGWEWGSQKKGRGYRQRPHQAQGCVGTQLAGAQGPMCLGHKAGSQASPPGRGWGRLSAPLTGMPEKMGSPREGQEHSPGSPWKEKSLCQQGVRMEDPLEINSWEAGQALEMERAGFKSRIGLF